MIGINLDDEFPLPDDLVYLNHAGIAPWPRRTARAIERLAEENTTQGPVRYEAWLAVEAELRDQLRGLLNAPSSDDIALVKNTSEALSFVAHGLDWRAGDNVVVPDQEFPSNRIVWESLAPRGVEVRAVDLSQADSPEAALIAAADAHTRLLSVSSVQYGTGLRMDLETLGRFCHDQRVLFCVDGIQSLGATIMDVQHIGADFVMADGHKWLLSPEGIGVFYCRAERRDELQLHQFGWHMVEHYGDFARREWQAARSARRFECGSPNMLGIHGLHASLSLMSEIGLHAIQRNILKNTGYLIDHLKNNDDITLLTPAPEARRAGIVTFRHEACDAALLHDRLRQHGVITARRCGGIRLSPHFYTSRRKLDQALDRMQRIVREARR